MDPGGGTRFISNGSGPPSSCQILGDSSLYGVGIRTSYYLQYTAALLSLLFLGGEDQKLWFLSFVPLAAANLVVLSLNSTSGNAGLVILDWAVVYGLVFWSAVFLISSICRDAVRGSSGKDGDMKRLRQDLEKEGGRMVSDQEAEWNARYVAVLRVLGTAEQAGSPGGLWRSFSNKQDALERALQDYVAAFTAVRSNPISADAAGYILDVYADGRVRDTAAGIMVDNKQVETFRDTHTEAIRRASIPFDQAQTTTQMLGRIARDGFKSAAPCQSPWRALQHLGARIPVMSLISSGLGLALYSGFTAFMVWLLFRGLNKGSASGCDVRVIFFVVPISIYSRGAMTALKVLSCVWLAVAGAPALLAGMALFVLGVVNWWAGSPPSRLEQDRHQGTPKDAADVTVASPTRADTAEKGKEAEVASPATQTQFSRASELYEMDEYPQPGSATATARDTRGSSYFDALLVKEAGLGRAESRTGTGIGTGIRGGGSSSSSSSWPRPRPRWEWLLVFPVAHMAAVVEFTIRINRVEMRQRSMTSMAELVAFFLGAFVFLRVVTRCAHEEVRRLRKRRSAGWFDERWKILATPASRLEDFEHGRGYGGGGVLGREISVGESSFGRDTERASRAKAASRIYLQPEPKSGSSMGKFKEMIDDD